MDVVASLLFLPGWDSPAPGAPLPDGGCSPPLLSTRSCFERAFAKSPCQGWCGALSLAQLFPGVAQGCPQGGRQAAAACAHPGAGARAAASPPTLPRAAGGRAVPAVPRCLSVCPAQGTSFLVVILIGRERQVIWQRVPASLT